MAFFLRGRVGINFGHLGKVNFKLPGDVIRSGCPPGQAVKHKIFLYWLPRLPYYWFKHILLFYWTIQKD